MSDFMVSFYPVLRPTQVLNFLSSRYALTNRQIAAVVYSSTDYGYWKARHDTKRMYDAGLVKRARIFGTYDYVYYCGEKPKELEHLIMVNWAWVRLHQLGVTHFENEKQLDGLKPDGYFVYNEKPYFLEVERATKNDFEKVALYTTYFESQSWLTPEWPGGNRFAPVLVITDETNNTYIKNKIAKDNGRGIRFRVATMQEFWKEPEVYLKWD